MNRKLTIWFYDNYKNIYNDITYIVIDIRTLTLNLILKEAFILNFMGDTNIIHLKYE